MIHPHTELRFISPEIGYGVVATKRIPKGTITWVLDRLDREFTPEQLQQMEAPFQKVLDVYAYRNNKGNLVLCWDHSRYVNHSFRANCLSTAYDFEIAIRDIEPGEELTDDYGYLNVSEPFRAMPEGTRRQVVYPDDLLKYHSVWDKKLEQAIRKFPSVDQPLRFLLSEETFDKAIKIANGQMHMDSILNNYYNPNSNGHKQMSY